MDATSATKALKFTAALFHGLTLRGSRLGSRLATGGSLKVAQGLDGFADSRIVGATASGVSRSVTALRDFSLRESAQQPIAKAAQRLTPLAKAAIGRLPRVAVTFAKAEA